MSYGRGHNTSAATTLALLLVVVAVALLAIWWEQAHAAAVEKAIGPPVVALHCQPRGNLPLWSEDGVRWHWPDCMEEL